MAQEQPKLGVTADYADREYHGGDENGGLNHSLRRLNVLVSSSVVNMTTNTPPVGTNGDGYVIGSSPTGSWVGHARELAFWNSKRTAFDIYYPTKGQIVFNLADGFFYYRDANATLTWQRLINGA